LKPEALLQLSLPGAILPLYSRGNHTSIYNTRHVYTHKRWRERKRERTESERLAAHPATPGTPAAFRVSDRNTA